MSILPLESGKSLILGLTNAASPDVALVLRGATVNATSELTPGVLVVFEGVATSFTTSPFLVTFDIEEGAVVSKPLGAMAPAWYIGRELGAVRNSRYRHHITRLEFDLPSDWKVESTRPSTGGDVVTLILSGFERVYAGVWMAGNTKPAVAIYKPLEAAPSEFMGPRTGLERYTIRSDSVQQRWIAGRQAVTAVADYEQNGEKMSQSLTWIVTEHTRALFFARATAYDLPLLLSHFDQIIQSAVIP